MTWRVARRLIAAVACAGWTASAVAGAGLRAIELRVDNDQFGFTGPSDERWYTSGVVLQGAFDAAPDAPDARLAAAWCVRIVACDPGARTLRVLSLSHRIFTPQLVSPSVPRPLDWPFGASLAFGSAIVVDGERTRQALGLELGVIGPAALGGPVQNALHRIIGQPRVEGWDAQVRAQPAVQLYWSRLARYRLDGFEGVDAVLRTGLRAGSPLTQAELGASLRFGRRPDGPSWPGESIGDRGRPGWHGFVGVEARAVAHDAMIDGDTYRVPSQVSHRPFAGSAFIGASWGTADGWRLDLALALQSVPLDAPGDTAWMRPQRIGTIGLRWAPQR